MTALEQFLEAGGLTILTRYALMLRNDNKEEAEDLVSTTLVAAVENPPHHDKNYEGWIVSLLHNRHVDYCRRAVAREHLEEGYTYWLGEASYQPDLETEVEAPMYRLSIKDILKRFRPMDRYILYSLYIKGRSLSEVRKIVGKCYSRDFPTYDAFEIYTRRLRDRVRMYLTALPDDDKSGLQTNGKMSPSTRLAA